MTTTLEIGTGICLVAQRDPIVLAKEVATLDLVSNGRFVLGIGFGWNREEMQSHGVAFHERRALVREKMLALLEAEKARLAKERELEKQRVDEENGSGEDGEYDEGDGMTDGLVDSTADEELDALDPKAARAMRELERASAAETMDASAAGSADADETVGLDDVPAGTLVDVGGQYRFRNDPNTPDTGVGAAPVIDIGAFEYVSP